MLFLRSFKKRAVLGNESEEIESFVVVALLLFMK